MKQCLDLVNMTVAWEGADGSMHVIYSPAVGPFGLGSGAGWGQVHAYSGPTAYTEECPPSITESSYGFVLMPASEHRELTRVANVNETVTVGLIFLAAVFGLGLGWWMFGPRRESVVEVVS